MPLYDLQKDDPLDVLVYPHPQQQSTVDNNRYDLVVELQGLEAVEIYDITRDQYDEFMRTHRIIDSEGTEYVFLIPSGVTASIILSIAD